MNIVCVGDCGIDHYVLADERRVGGITTNFALQARRCFAHDDRLQVIAPLGNDAAAELVRNRFAGNDIECRFTVMSGNTPVQSIEIDSRGERQFTAYDAGVLKQFRIKGEDAAYIRCADLVVSPVFEQNRKMFSSLMAVERQGMTAIDFSDFAQHADFALLNRYSGQIDVGFFGLHAGQTDIMESLRLIADTERILIVVTLGEHGSKAYHNGSVFERIAQPVQNVVDTTGAGDAFAAGFLSNYCRSSDIDAALSTGAALAASVVQKYGAI